MNLILGKSNHTTIEFVRFMNLNLAEWEIAELSKLDKLKKKRYNRILVIGEYSFLKEFTTQLMDHVVSLVSNPQTDILYVP